MKYVADVLTALRVLSALVVLLSAYHGAWALATAVFLFGILSDAFDGPAARRWQYTDEENARKWWRKDPHVLDNIADVSLNGAGMVALGFTLLPVWAAIVTIVTVGAVSFGIQMVVDHVGREDPERAERIDVRHGWLFGAELAFMLVSLTVLATPDWPLVIAVYVVGSVPLLWFKWDRVTSRQELDYGAK